MNFYDGVSLIQEVPCSREKAIPAETLAKRLRKSSSTIQRWLRDLSQLEPQENEQLIDCYLFKYEKDGKYVYYRNERTIEKKFISKDHLLGSLLASDVLNQHFSELTHLNTVNFQTDEENALPRDLKNIRKSVRIVPDGLGRLPAEIKKDIVNEIIAALAANQKIKIEYRSPKSVNTTEKEYSPAGLIAKDGSLYFLAYSTSGHYIHLATHRIESAKKQLTPSNLPQKFTIDDYIKNTHMFSHPLNDNAKNVNLVLRVAPETIYHFRERKLCETQKIFDPSEEDNWFRVEATIPNTILLVPFLISMGHWIKVVEPREVREKIKEWIDKSYEHYKNDLIDKDSPG